MLATIGGDSSSRPGPYHKHGCRERQRVLTATHPRPRTHISMTIWFECQDPVLALIGQGEVSDPAWFAPVAGFDLGGDLDNQTGEDYGDRCGTCCAVVQPYLWHSIVATPHKPDASPGHSLEAYVRYLRCRRFRRLTNTRLGLVSRPENDHQRFIRDIQADSSTSLLVESTAWTAMSGSKRQRPDPVAHDLPLKRLRAVSISSPLSSPTNDYAAPAEAIPNQTALTPSLPTLPATPIMTQATQVATSPAISALKTTLGGLRDSLTELPPLQMAVGDLLECIIHTEVEAQNRRAFDELASDLANLATLLQSHAAELKPYDGPYSIANVVRVIEEQISLVKAQQEHSRTVWSNAAKDDEEMVLECYRRIGALFPHLQSGILSLRDEPKERNMDTIRKELCPVYDAFHNAALPSSATKRVGCTRGTRMDLLNTALDWAHGGDAAKIYWLNGMAGTGKTTIAYTLCEILQQDKLLAASFFCSRNSADCRNVHRVVPTVAYQLAQNLGVYRQELLKALRSDSDAPKRNIATQFRHLISEPFEKIREAVPKDVIVVIDALDECDDEAGTKTVLDLLIRHAAKLPIKFFISSRPEPSISDSMEAQAGALRSIVWLHDIEKSLVQADIRLYLTEALESVGVFPPEIDQLAARAGNLFIFAATAVRYILPDRGTVNRRQRLQTILDLQPSQKHRSYQDIDNLYATILANALDTNIYEEYEVDARQRVLWTAICAREPLTILALAEILQMPGEDVRSTIQSLQSVLHTSEISSAVSALHASFPDFLLSTERAGEFYCDEVVHNSKLAACCFEVMGRSLKFNICGLESSYVFNKDAPNLQNQVEKAISTGLFYSCRYWGDHLTKSPPSCASALLMQEFLQKYLLFWMEALHLKQHIDCGGDALSKTLVWLPLGGEWAELRDFAHDAQSFLTSFASNPTSLSTPHIYISTLPFTSKDSRVRTTYWSQMRGLVEIEGVATDARGKSALAVWNLRGYVYNIAQSSDGRRLAIGYHPKKVGVWDVSSGTCILGPLEGHHDEVRSIAFSPDNSCIASGSRDGTIRMWDAHNGDLVVGPLAGHTSDVNSVAFSPDGTRLASGSGDCTIRMWDAHTGAEIGDAYRHQRPVLSIAFSPDTEQLVSGSVNHTIGVWNWRTGVAARGPLEGHSGWVGSVAYSSDGLRLASGSEDNTVRVWDMSSGTLLAGPFKGHTREVMSVSFSPNDTQVVSGSVDCTIRVWEAESGNLLAGPFTGHRFAVTTVLFTTDGTRILSGSDDGTTRVWDARHRTMGATESSGHSGGIQSIAMSPDGTRVASGSLDKTICVWDTHSSALVAGPFKGHTQWVASVAFSPDGARIVSGSSDCTLRTWDASTGALLVGPFKGYTFSLHPVAFSPDGSQIASGSHDKTIQLWDSHTGESIAEPFEGHTKIVQSIAFSPVGARIVSGSFDYTVRMWDANTGTALWTSSAHTREVNCVAFSPCGTRVVSGSRDKTLLVLDADHGTVLHGPFTGHTHDVNSVAFSPDGTCVVSGSDDRTVCVWDVQSGTVVVGPLKGHTQSVRSVAFSPDGTRIISGSWDGTIRFWDVDAATRPDTTLLDGWSIDDNGWVIDSQSRRLFWVPSDLRDGFWFPTPSNPLVSNARSTTHVDTTTSLGDRWHLCYDASSGSGSS